MLLWVLVEVFIALILFFLVNQTGALLTGKACGGMNDSDDVAQNSRNAMFRVVSPAFYWMLVHAALNYLLFPISMYACISIVIYWLLRLAYEYSKKTLSLSNYKSMWARALISTALCFFLFDALESMDWNIVPAASDVMSQFWLVAFTVLVLAASGTTRSESRKDQDKLLEKYYYQLKRLAEERLPATYSSDLLLRALFYSFGLYEMTYRTKPIRFIERCIAQFRHNMTTGIMQVKSNHALSDEESIDLAANIVLDIWKGYLTKSERARNNGKLEMEGASYSYSLSGMCNAVRADYEVIHKRYTGTSLNNTKYYFEFALRMIREDDYLIIDEKTIDGCFSGL